MTKAKLNNALIATVAGDITVYNYDEKTREYLSSCVEYLAIGVGIPANACIDAPGDIKDGFALCRSVSLNKWEYVADHRGETVYSTETGEAAEILSLGDYPENTTELALTTPYDTWDDNKWTTDVEAQRIAEIAAGVAEIQRHITQANEYMNGKQWPGKAAIGRLKSDELAQYGAWLDYIDALEAIDTTHVPDIEYPTHPVALVGR